MSPLPPAPVAGTSGPLGARRAAPLLLALLLPAAVPAAVRAQAPPPPKTTDFVQAAAESGRFEIAEAEDAVVQSRDPRVRAFAQRMIADHERLNAELAQAAAGSGVPPPPPVGVGDSGQKLLAAVQSLRGADFDRTYARQQVLAHQEALIVQRTYAERGSDPAVRRAAAAAVPIIEAHLSMAEQLRDAVAPPGSP